VPANEAVVAKVGGHNAGGSRPRRTRPDAPENAIVNPTIINTGARHEAFSEAEARESPIRDPSTLIAAT